MDSIFHDIRVSLRQLRLNPGFALLVVCTIALGIGSNSILFSVVDGILLRPLDYGHPEHLVTVWNRLPGLPPLEASFSKPEMVDLRDQAPSFEQVGAFGYGSSNVIRDEGATILWTAWISSNLLAMLEVEPILGRGFAPEDHLQDNKVALVNYDFWHDQLGGDPKVVGQTLRIDQDLYTIIGVLPGGFQLPLDFQWAGKTPLILPLLDPAATDQREVRYIHVLGRLKKGVSLERAQTEADTVAHRFQLNHPHLYPSAATWRLEVQPVHEVIVGKTRPALLLLFGAVGFVLLIACVNLANLLLARALARSRENAMRLALGAGRSRLSQQLLIESLVLTLVGGAFGLLLASWGIRLLIALSPGNIPRLDGVGLDGRVVAFTVVLSVATGLLLGMVPIIKSWSVNLQSTLKQGGRSASGGAGEHRLRRALVVAEVALSLLLLIGAGLTIRSFLGMRHIDIGFDPEQLAVLAVTASSAEYPADHQVKAFYDTLLERVGRLPGVEAAGGATSLPFHVSAPRRPVVIEGHVPAPGDPELTAGIQVASHEYFPAMRARLVAGRLFSPEDREGAPLVAVLNATFARDLGGEVVGKRLQLPDPRKPDEEKPWRQVIGVIDDFSYTGLEEEAAPEVYLPWRQQDFAQQSTEGQGRSLFLTVRTTGDPAQLGQDLRRQVHALAPTMPLGPPWVMATDLYATSISQPRFTMVLLSVFGCLALFLAAVGIYGVLSYLAEQRRQEIGVRMALGADRSLVLRLLLGEGVALVTVGLVLGVVFAFWLTRLLASQLFEIRTHDPLTFAVSTLVLLMVGLFASFLPARRATRVDPLAALRQE